VAAAPGNTIASRDAGGIADLAAIEYRQKTEDESEVAIRMSKAQIRKVVLAYSGGLDTSVMLRWIKDYYNCEVITYCADVGQGDETDGL
jgi:tRNA(Ile)-lysidine synthase TilS/MesJ